MDLLLPREGKTTREGEEQTHDMNFEGLAPSQMSQVVGASH